MELLTPEKIKQQADARVAERQRRAKAAGEEEAQILHRLNDARDEEERQKALKDLDTQKKITPLEARLFELQDEVPALEERKKEALAPIVEREEAVTQRETDAETKEKELVARETALKEAEDKVLDRAERLQDGEDNLNDRTAKLRQREITHAKAEDENKRTASALSDKWLEHHNVVHNQNADMSKREAAVESGRKANAIKEEEQRMKDFSYEARENAITDKYGNFVKSVEEWEKKNPEAPKTDTTL